MPDFDIDFDFGEDQPGPDPVDAYREQQAWLAERRSYEPQHFQTVPGCPVPVTKRWPGDAAPYQDNATWHRRYRRVRLDAKPAAFYVSWRGTGFRLPLYTVEQTEHHPFTGVEGESVYRRAADVPDSLKSRAAWAREGRRLRPTACHHAVFGMAKLYPVAETEPMRRRRAAGAADDVPADAVDVSDLVAALQPPGRTPRRVRLPYADD